MISSIEAQPNSHVITLSLPQHQQLWLALSGGLDSVVLLDLVAHWCQLNAKSLNLIHIHHGLSPNADQWAEHCQQLCLQYQQRFKLKMHCQVHPVQLDPAAGNIEEQARSARYQIFEQQLQHNDLLLMAHHADDQAETLLLRLLRGAGSQGLAAMPAYRPLGQGQLFRPLLGYSRAQLESYAKQHLLHWVEDESNLSTDFDRNYLRHNIMPSLKQRWQNCAELFTRAARNLAETTELTQALAEIDLNLVQQHSAYGTVIDCTSLQQLSRARQINLLRSWFKTQGMPELEHKQWQVVFNEVVDAKVDAEPCFSWQGYQLRRFRHQLYLLPPMQAFDTKTSMPLAELPLSQSNTESLQLRLDTGVLTLSTDLDHGTPRLYLPDEGRLWIQYRQGGETILLPKRGRKQLKKLLQESDIPPWLRQRLPLVWWQSKKGEPQLIAVANLWVSEIATSKASERGWQIKWTDNSHS